MMLVEDCRMCACDVLALMIVGGRETCSLTFDLVWMEESFWIAVYRFSPSPGPYIW